MCLSDIRGDSCAQLITGFALSFLVSLSIWRRRHSGLGAVVSGWWICVSVVSAGETVLQYGYSFRSHSDAIDTTVQSWFRLV